MKGTHAEKFIKKQFNLIRKNIPESFSLKKGEAIHDYRVALKRINAILNFIVQHNLRKNISSLYRITKLHKIYKTGGALREIQINRKILDSYRERLENPFSSFSNFLKQKNKTYRRKFRKVRVKFSFRKCHKFERLLLGVFHKIPENEMLALVDHFISGRIAEIELLIMGHHVEDKLHRIRKLVKRIKYMLELSGLENRNYGSLNFNIERIGILEDHIGHWHDLFVFREEINAYIERIHRLGRNDHDIDLLSGIVDEEYQKQFTETVDHIYTDFDIQRDVAAAN
jgi:CHAD domain-containing protein